jgi:hypothetical protein
MKENDIRNHPLYYKNNEIVLWQTYNETYDGSLRIHDDVYNHQAFYPIHYKVFSKHLVNFVKDKIIVDAGSGTGRHFPIFSTFNPTKIVSVEMYDEFIPVQKKFASCIFPFLKNKKIETPIDYYHETMEAFVDRNLQVDTIFFYEDWHVMNFNYIFNKVNCDMIFYTHSYTPCVLEEVLKEHNYTLIKKIETPKGNNTFKDYFYAIAKKA